MKKVLIGISGGVDSSVSALLLKDEGYDVVGGTMRLTCNQDNSDAIDVCKKLDIDYVELDYKNEFEDCVIKYFIDEYSNCKTPNPCIMCNKKLKFGLFFDYAKENNIDYIATGHYAKIEYSEKYKRYVLKKANNQKKDQSYFLYSISKEILPYIKFPLGYFNSKDEIRAIASLNNLKVASKSDSQDICFIPDGNYKKFLENNGSLTPKIGNIIFEGKVIGTHTGLYKYTIGQRKGLGISYMEPLFVIGFNKDKNELIVGKEQDLYKKSFKVKDYNLLLVDKIDEPIKVSVKTRYKSREYDAIIKMEDEFINVEFLEPQKGITKGQVAVFYLDDIVVGGGIII